MKKVSFKLIFFIGALLIFLILLIKISYLPKKGERENIKAEPVKAVEVSHKHEKRLPLFPKEDPFSDRILNQIKYVPPNYNKQEISLSQYKTIYSVTRLQGQQLGPNTFKDCPVSTCTFVENNNADLFVSMFHLPEKIRDDQLTLFLMFESPLRLGNVSVKTNYDLTSTYRFDSDIVYPYAKFKYHDERIKTKVQTKNYANNKTKMAAWFVSNCVDVRNNRMEMARALQNFIPVDIYGKCGELKCPRGDQGKCYRLLRENYKFYLAFENSNCTDYITEKFFHNGLSNDLIPIVLGGHKEDYEKVAPIDSFIHVDDFDSVESLAKYLKLLNEDDTLYNSYFRWKDTGYFIDSKYWCRVCGILHMPKIDKTKLSLYQKDFHDWWAGEGVCW